MKNLLAVPLIVIVNKYCKPINDLVLKKCSIELKMFKTYQIRLREIQLKYNKSYDLWLNMIGPIKGLLH